MLPNSFTARLPILARHDTVHFFGRRTHDYRVPDRAQTRALPSRVAWRRWWRWCAW